MQEIAFNNLKFVISLQISLSHYDPNQVLLITSDSSQMSMNASYYNFDTKACELKLLDTQTKLFTKSEINYAPVKREARSMMYALSHGEPYIRNNAVEMWLLVDANSLQYISRNKAYSSRQYNDSIFVSTLPRLNVFYVSGKALLLSDILSRSFQDVYLNQSF